VPWMSRRQQSTTQRDSDTAEVCQYAIAHRGCSICRRIQLGAWCAQRVRWWHGLGGGAGGGQEADRHKHTPIATTRRLNIQVATTHNTRSHLPRTQAGIQRPVTGRRSAVWPQQTHIDGSTVTRGAVNVLYTVQRRC